MAVTPKRRYGWPSVRSELIPIGTRVECVRGTWTYAGRVVDHATLSEYRGYAPKPDESVGYVIMSDTVPIMGSGRSSWWSPGSVVLPNKGLS